MVGDLISSVEMEREGSERLSTETGGLSALQGVSFSTSSLRVLTGVARARDFEAGLFVAPNPEAMVLKAPVAPTVMALRPKLAVLGMIVTGRRRTLVKPARTFRLTWAGFREERKVGSERASSSSV